MFWNILVEISRTFRMNINSKLYEYILWRLKRKSTIMIFEIWKFTITKMVILHEKYQQKHYFHELQFSIWSKNRNQQCLGNLFGPGHRRKTTDRLIQRKFKLDRQKSASAVKVEIENELGISLHVDTIRNRAHEARLFGRIARKKPYVNKINRGKRLKFAKEMLEKLSSFWGSVIWSDE